MPRFDCHDRALLHYLAQHGPVSVATTIDIRSLACQLSKSPEITLLAITSVCARGRARVLNGQLVAIEPKQKSGAKWSQARNFAQ